MMTRSDMELGTFINGIYNSFMAIYHDPELALIATEVTLTEMIHSVTDEGREEDLAA